MGGLFDQNIFMQRAQLQQAQPSVLDRLAQGFAMGQQKQQMDLQRRQLEAKANEMDFEQIAQQSVYKEEMGIPLTQQDMAARQVMAKTKADQTYFDPVIKELVVRPNPYKSLVGDRLGIGSVSQGAPVPPVDRLGGPALEDMQMGGMGSPDSFSFGDAAGPMMVANQSAAQAGATEMGGPNPYATVPGSALPQAPKVTGPLAGTRAAQSMEAESQMRLGEKTAAEEIALKLKKEDLINYNENQLAAANFANRMNESRKVLDGLGDKGQDAKTGWAGTAEAIIGAVPSFGATDKIGAGIVKTASTPEQKRYLSEAQNWIRANLRKESGAAIYPEEMASEYANYFPMPGDDKQIIEDKKRRRLDAETGVISQSAGAYQLAFGKKAQSQQATDAQPKRRKYNAATGKLE